MSSPITNTDLHPFERAGLGKAPFKYLGVFQDVGPKTVIVNGLEMQVGAPGQPMGTCNYCGQGIKDCYRVRGASGDEFIVGCDCVRKLSRSDNERRDPVIAAIDRDRRKLVTERRHVREDARIAEGVAWFEEHLRAKAEKMAHGQKWRAEQGETLADEWDWWMNHAGRAGKLKFIRWMRQNFGGEE